MKSFVEIETLFNSIEERNIDFLSGLYQNGTKLKAVVHKLLLGHFSTSEIRGKSLMIKPNWVRHELSESDYLCLRTNDRFLLCVLEEFLNLQPSKVLIADAPVQGCDWDRMISKEFISEIAVLSGKYDIPIIVKDLRRTVTSNDGKEIKTELRPISDYVLFDLGSSSYLEPITSDDNKFRVTCYDPDRMAEVHRPGIHKYCIAKDVFEYDIIVTIPKLKTHRMAGMTNALKLLVGINGDKDYLPHHRIGSLEEGGDNYKDKSIKRTLANLMTDESNRHRGTVYGSLLGKVGGKLWAMSKPDSATMMNAGWYGNDTIWRTVMDIDTIALFGDKQGRLHEEQQRSLFIIMDGVIGGQGDGPLHPDPSPLGVIAVSNCPYLMDVVAGELYHLKYNRIPLLNQARKIVNNKDYNLSVNQIPVSLDDIAEYGIDILMSPGWVEYDK